MPRYEFVEGTSSKFWEIQLEGTSFTTTYGKIGTSGQSTTKSFKDEATAKKEHDKLVAEKTKKGYVLVGGGGAAAPAPAAKAARDDEDEATPAPKAAGKKKAPAAAEPAPAPAPAPASSAPSGARRYELVEGTSAKFWQIELQGASFTTTYGKLGTAGQSTTKSFADEAAAKKEHDKLVAEKTKKGYALVSGGGGGEGGGGGGGGGGGAGHARAGTAFRMADLEQLDDRPFEHSETFMGLKVAPYDPEEGGLKDAARRAWRVGLEEGEIDAWLELWSQFVADPNAGKVKAVVVGTWAEPGTSMDPGSPEAVRLIQAICEAKGALTSLAALFLCDIHADEQEVSWQNLADVSPLLQAYPNLQHLRVRGAASQPGMGQLRSERLRSLQLEGSNHPQAVVEQVAAGDLPALEHLEVWLGPDEYAGAKDLSALTPVLSGKLFPSLRYLGLRDSDVADEVARAAAQAPLLDRLEVLDLSLGNLGDEGAEALLASPAVARLKKLDLRHHYVSDELIKKLRAHLSAGKLAERRSDEEEYDGQRFVAVSE